MLDSAIRENIPCDVKLTFSEYILEDLYEFIEHTVTTRKLVVIDIVIPDEVDIAPYSDSLLLIINCTCRSEFCECHIKLYSTKLGRIDAPSNRFGVAKYFQIWVVTISEPFELSQHRYRSGLSSQFKIQRDSPMHSAISLYVMPFKKAFLTSTVASLQFSGLSSLFW